MDIPIALYIIILIKRAKGKITLGSALIKVNKHFYCTETKIGHLIYIGIELLTLNLNLIAFIVLSPFLV